MARVISIYKSENRSKCENYRPISILPIISKVFERQVFNQIYRYLNENSLISKFKSRFRPKYGTVSALIQMCDQWLTDVDSGKLNGVVFLDICKAFDSVNHEFLLRKLKDQFGIRSAELKWFESYLTNRKQSISRADTFTCLGVDLDEKLSWEKHIEKICGMVSAEIGAMRRIKPFVPPVTLQTIYKTLVQPYFDYCSPLWDI